ncbi:SulP family inorganic anion transporter [Nitrosospira lacus]|uniref:Sulfate transporter n=1 Tax=Nitrosospira lacus TaxID=1288494 RepID=A0A1W6SND7_9PROT|nr:SulP family inorganic anion transporter [Nitrosospira lacus]ARO87315.1 SulP family inorganic anion transporter [Nitrosospira lacus]
MSSYTSEKPLVPSDDHQSGGTRESVTPVGSAGFQAKYVARDIQAGIITGAMAIPLSVGIALMSEYPIKVALATVAFACFIGWINAFIRPGNYIGAPGVAAGLAPVLAMGVHSFGIENMAFVIFLTSAMQALIWKYDWQKYILLAVPSYLVEGLLAGVGLKIALKFLTFTYELPADQEAADAFWNGARIQMALISLAGFATFVYLFSKFKDTKPAIPYFLLIGASIVLAQFMPMSMLHVDDVDLALALPVPHFDSALTWMYVIGFAAMLAVIDVIEQVMSNAAIEKIDPLKRKCNTNNSLLAIWIANMGSSFFGGMTNLDGLAKSTTNKLAGAMTKFSVFIIGIVVTFFVMNSQYLEFLPKFSLAAIMIFSGWKMIMGLWHVAHYGQYAMILATLCGLLVYKVGIFEGLLIAMAVHGLVNYLVFKQAGKIPSKVIVKKYFEKFSANANGGAD